MTRRALGRGGAHPTSSRPAALCAVAVLATSLAWLGVGCSESAPTHPADAGLIGEEPMVPQNPDSAPPPDAPPSDVASSDASAPDVSSGDASSTDGDAVCACSVVDKSDTGPIPTTGIFPMACYCAKQDWHDDFAQRPNCPSYDEAIECPDGARSYHIATYKNCNYVTVNYDVGNAVDMRVYDATTHELVGALRGTDFVVSNCGSTPVGMVSSGIVPGPECVVDKRVRPCDKTGGGMDAGDVDGASNDGGACECTLNDDGWGQIPLGCYCDKFGPCRSYAASLRACGPPINAFMAGLSEYAGCNLSVIYVNWPSVLTRYFYDFTTHELVGATGSARVNVACGDGGTGAFRAGMTTIDPGCMVTKQVQLCPNRGDAAIDETLWTR